MIIKCPAKLPILPSDRDETYPVLALQTGVLFPGNVLAINVRRPESLRLIEDCVQKRREFIATYTPVDAEAIAERPVHQVGVFATVQERRSWPGGTCLVTIEGRRRAVLHKIVGMNPYLTATARELQPPRPASRSVMRQVESVIAIVGEITRIDPAYSLELAHVLKMYHDNPSYLADHVAASLHFALADKQKLLEAVGLRERYARLLDLLSNELHRLVPGSAVLSGLAASSVTGGSATLTGITAGPPMSLDEPTRIKSLVKGSRFLPPEVIARATLEADRLTQLSSASAEYGATKIYLETVLALPWGKFSPEDYEMAEVRRSIDADYFGPRYIKDTILQRLSVRKLQGGLYDGPTLCLVGGPGTGKASLAKAVAAALGKEFLRVSVGGISEIAEIKGTPRTYVGAMPGKIIRTFQGAGSCDPVVLIEDIDYFNPHNDAGVNAALLEVIDTRYNAAFLDEYLGVAFDLSRVCFICSVRSHEEIPEQFIPRLELLEIPGYIDKEKITIAKRYIIPEMLRKHGILKSEFRISERALTQMIGSYTQEAGLLQCSQQLERLCRKVALEKVEKKRASWSITEKRLSRYLGPPQYIPEKAESVPEIGIAAGVAWTGAGGDLMFIEGLKMKGEGQIITTGSLGEVMKESIQAAHSYVRSKADILGIDANDFKEFDIHIHFPSGAIPKDGPSAGVTVCLVIASVMAERPIRNDVAMTGEVTLRGKVLPVGGVKEKIAAAYRSGIFHVALPKENEKDVKDLPQEILRNCQFSYLERIDELFALCLMDFTPSAFTLEKVFAEEIEKAKAKARRQRKARLKLHPKAAKKRSR